MAGPPPVMAGPQSARARESDQGHLYDPLAVPCAMAGGAWCAGLRFAPLSRGHHVEEREISLFCHAPLDDGGTRGGRNNRIGAAARARLPPGRAVAWRTTPCR